MDENIQMSIHEFPNMVKAKEAILQIGADPRGAEILKEKAVFRVVQLNQVPLKAANLLKQTFLAKGADAAVSWNTSAFRGAYTDVILLGTVRQYRLAIAELQLQPFGLKVIADALVTFLLKIEEKSAGI